LSAVDKVVVSQPGGRVGGGEQTQEGAGATPFSISDFCISFCIFYSILCIRFLSCVFQLNSGCPPIVSHQPANHPPRRPFPTHCKAPRPPPAAGRGRWWGTPTSPSTRAPRASPTGGSTVFPGIAPQRKLASFGPSIFTSGKSCGPNFSDLLGRFIFPASSLPDRSQSFSGVIRHISVTCELQLVFRVTRLQMYNHTCPGEGRVCSSCSHLHSRRFLAIQTHIHVYTPGQPTP